MHSKHWSFPASHIFVCCCLWWLSWFFVCLFVVFNILCCCCLYVVFILLFMLFLCCCFSFSVVLVSSFVVVTFVFVFCCCCCCVRVCVCVCVCVCWGGGVFSGFVVVKLAERCPWLMVTRSSQKQFLDIGNGQQLKSSKMHIIISNLYIYVSFNNGEMQLGNVQS